VELRFPPYFPLDAEKLVVSVEDFDIFSQVAIIAHGIS